MIDMRTCIETKTLDGVYCLAPKCRSRSIYAVSQHMIELALDQRHLNILVDKRQFSMPLELSMAQTFGVRLGDLLQAHRARLAVVAEYDDQQTTMICFYAQHAGARVLATPSLTEALEWLREGML